MRTRSAGDCQLTRKISTAASSKSPARSAISDSRSETSAPVTSRLSTLRPRESRISVAVKPVAASKVVPANVWSRS
jgi:hypothetical protein